MTWWGGQFASGLTPADASVITETARAHTSVLGSDADMYGGPYGSDLRLLQGLGGIPTIQYGPGDARAAHAPNEWVPIDEVFDCARVLTRLILEVCA